MYPIWFCIYQPAMKKALRIVRVRIYSSTLALLSKCLKVALRLLNLVTLGSDDQIRSSAPAATEASAMAFPWAISTSFEARSQSVVWPGQDIERDDSTCRETMEELTICDTKNSI